MPTKVLDSQAGRNGVQKTFKFGGGANTIIANDDEISDFGYFINSGGGDDDITGSDFFRLLEVPDPTEENPDATIFIIDGGDLLIGGDGSDNIEGGLGNDIIFGGNEDGTDSAKGKYAEPRNLLFGDDDIFDTTGTYDAGNDILVGGADGSNLMVGDVGIAGGGGIFNGGNDILISGMNADDNMTGDFGSARGATINGGEDTFVFGGSNGVDLITDFEQGGKDTINLTATGLAWADLDTNDIVGLDDGDDHVTITAYGDTIIDLGQAIDDTALAGVDTIRVSQVTGLVEGDFDFLTVIDPGLILV